MGVLLEPTKSTNAPKTSQGTLTGACKLENTDMSIGQASVSNGAFVCRLLIVKELDQSQVVISRFLINAVH